MGADRWIKSAAGLLLPNPQLAAPFRFMPCESCCVSHTPTGTCFENCLEGFEWTEECAEDPTGCYLPTATVTIGGVGSTEHDECFDCAATFEESFSAEARLLFGAGGWLPTCQFIMQGGGCEYLDPVCDHGQDPIDFRGIFVSFGPNSVPGSELCNLVVNGRVNSVTRGNLACGTGWTQEFTFVLLGIPPTGLPYSLDPVLTFVTPVVFPHPANPLCDLQGGITCHVDIE